MPQDGIDSISMVVSPNFAEDGTLSPAHLTTESSIRWIEAAVGRRGHYGMLDLGVFATAVSPLFAQDQTVLAGTSTGIFFSPMEGLRGVRRMFPMRRTRSFVFSFSPNFRHDSLIAAGTEAGILLKSLDAGRTWSYMETPCAGSSINALTFLAQEDSGPLMILAAATCIHVSASGYPCWRSWDAGHAVLTLASCTDGEQQSFVLAGLKDSGIWRGQPQIGNCP